MEEGKRFSQIYLERGAPVRESRRFRNRLSAYFDRHLRERTNQVAPADKPKQGLKFLELLPTITYLRFLSPTS